MNKQKFLAELGRLLTFMYEEDRLHALELYEDIFDEVGDENAVLQMLVSPTRQAVNLARAYDAKERKYQDGSEPPAYEQVIEDLRVQAASLIPAAPRYEPAPAYEARTQEPEENYFDSFGFNNLSAAEGKYTPVPPAHQTYAPYPDEEEDEDSLPSTPPPVIVAEEPAPEEPKQEVDDFADAVDAFLADFSIDEKTLRQDTPDAPVPAEPEKPAEPEWEITAMPKHAADPKPDFEWAPPDEEPEEAPAPEKPAEAAPAAQPEKPEPAKSEPAKSVPAAIPDLPDPDEPKAKKYKANVPLLILFIILAIPVGICLAGLLVSAACAVLGLAGAVLWTGVNGLILAFSSFSVFADFLLVFGMGLACAALGLLLLWLFIWLLAGAIPGVVRGLCSLGRRLTYKEVAA